MAHLEVLQRHRRYRLLVQINRHTKAEILASQSEPWVDGGWRVWSGETRESEVGTSAVARAASARDAVLLSLCWLQNLAARVQQWRFHYVDNQLAVSTDSTHVSEATDSHSCQCIATVRYSAWLIMNPATLFCVFPRKLVLDTCVVTCKRWSILNLDLTVAYIYTTWVQVNVTWSYLTIKRAELNRAVQLLNRAGVTNSLNLLKSIVGLWKQLKIRGSKAKSLNSFAR